MDISVRNQDDVSIVRSYLQFVGHLLENNEIEAAKETAENLSGDPSLEDGVPSLQGKQKTEQKN